MTSAGTPAIEAALRRAERRLIAAMALRPRELQPRFARAHGRWNDAPVTMTTRTFEGDTVAYMRVVTITGTQLALAELLVCARPNRALPILGAQVVSRGATGDTTVDVDLTPVGDRPHEDAQRKALAYLLPDLSALSQGDAQSGWHRGWASPTAMHTRVGRNQLTRALAALDRHVDAWITLAGSDVRTPGSADAVRRSQQEYTRGHRVDAETRSLLGLMFGRAWADEYVAAVLYATA